MHGYRELPAAASLRGAHYKAAPRDGVWATPPFLHNGSVPNLYEMLIPARERTKKFYIGREFDPVKVGLDTTGKSGTFLVDTSLRRKFECGPLLREWPSGEWRHRPAADRRTALGDRRVSEIHSRRSRPGYAVWRSAKRGQTGHAKWAEQPKVASNTEDGSSNRRTSNVRPRRRTEVDRRSRV